MTDLTGGLIYHPRAWRHQNSLWMPFKKSLSDWLQANLKPSRQLLWIGASGGYCLPETLLSSYSQIVVCEPDPIARFVLKKRLARLPLHLIAEDQLKFNQRPFTLDSFSQLLASYPDAEILFSNLLGQISQITQNADLTSVYFAELQKILGQRSWLSFHDRLSCQSRNLQLKRQTLAPRASLTAELLASEFWQFQDSVVVLDHHTESLERGQKPLYLHWQLTEKQYHLIACVRSPS